ncbi:hypothetical protein KKA53_01110 [Candidatus Dependentiae bacterium]|nr:hypothetical protein [Candidatus Dependentiae bacterium]
MITVKLSSCCPKWDWIRQTPNRDGTWGEHTFICNHEGKSCDYWVVYENLTKQEHSSCPKENTVLITGEPPTIKTYHPKFLAQFQTIITCHPNVSHPNAIVSHLSLPWMIGYQPPKEIFSKSYRELTKTTKLPKTKLVSVICSDKVFTTEHKKRLLFIQKLQEKFGDRIDFYGRGRNPIIDKWDAIAPYKYHIALENSFIEHYWTEKLSDSYLAQSHPIYYGCPNIHDYFPKKSLTKIDINKPEQAFKVIEQVITGNTYEQSIETLEQAKKLVLNKYNIFPRLAKLCPQTDISKPKPKTTLWPQEYFYKQDPKIKKITRRVKYFFTRRTP